MTPRAPRCRELARLLLACLLATANAAAQEQLESTIDDGSSPGPSVDAATDVSPQELEDQLAEGTLDAPKVDPQLQAGPYALKQPLEPDAVEAQLRPLLDKHAFCAKKDYRVPPFEREFCSLSEQARARCPAIAEACRAAQPEPPKPGRSLDGIDLSVLSLLRALVWLVVIGGLVLVVVSIVRRLVSVKDTADEAEDPELPVSPDEAEAAPPGALETDVDRLLARARQAAERGDFAAAVRDAYAALLRKLDRDGLIEVHRSKTNGDYRRALSHTPLVQAEFATIVRTVEGIQFGSERPTEQAFQSVWQKVLALAGRSLQLLVLLLTALASVACQEIDRDPPASALGCGETPGGYSVLCELVAAHGTSVKRRIRRLDEIDESVNKLIVLEEAALNSDEWQVLDDWVKAGHALVLGRVSNPLSDELQVTLAAKPCKTPPLVHPTVHSTSGATVRLAAPRHAMALVADTSWVLSACDAGPTLVGTTHGDGSVLVLPNSTFLRNVSLAAADNAYFAANVIARDAGNVEVIGEWTGSGSSNPLDAIRGANLTPWLFQLLVVAGLLALWKGPHFGLPRDPVSSKRHAFVEHIQALGLKYARSKASGYALSHYGAWALTRLHERVLPGSRATMSELSGALAKLTGREENDVLKILIAAKSAQDEAHDTATPEEHLKTMRELESLLKAAGGTR
ncbi:MAG TPA: DUF4350 domain-containing protein [Polyangiaceae bacterium]